MTITQFEFNMFQENCYVLWDETKEAVIIDPGCFFSDEKAKLKDFILDNELKVKYVLNTHLHLDHIFGNAFLEQEFGLLPLAHKADEFLIPKLAEFGSIFGLEINEPAPNLGGYIEDGDEITFGNTTLKALHVPGHSPGSIAFYYEKEKIVFSGDVLFLHSIGRTDFEGGNHEQLINSIKTKLYTLPDETMAYPGHGETTTIGYEKMYNPYTR